MVFPAFSLSSHTHCGEPVSPIGCHDELFTTTERKNKPARRALIAVCGLPAWLSEKSGSNRKATASEGLPTGAAPTKCVCTYDGSRCCFPPFSSSIYARCGKPVTITSCHDCLASTVHARAGMHAETGKQHTKRPFRAFRLPSLPPK